MTSLCDILNRFSFLELHQTSQSDRDCRFEQKYLLPLPACADLLDNLRSDFSMLRINETSNPEYQNQYYDTPDYQFYTDHRRGVRPRIKIRLRRYVASGESFLELKQKMASGAVSKMRTLVRPEHGDVNGQLIRNEFGSLVPIPEPLVPVLDVCYRRFSLFNPGGLKVTIDCGLNFSTPVMTVAANDWGIVEIKALRAGALFPLAHRLLALGLRRTGFSKYCFGAFHLCGNLQNRLFSPLLGRLPVRRLNLISAAHAL